MASSKSYSDFVLGQFFQLKEVIYRPMMGEYIVYRYGKVVGCL